MDIFKLPVHPAAEMFPELDGEDLRNLAEDIKQSGLRQPIVIAEIDGKELLIDGRNRRNACKLAGVKDPPVERLNGGMTAEQYIVSANILRRHLTKGQQAILWAQVMPDGHQGKATSPAQGAKLGRNSMTLARTVVREAPDLAQAVLSGSRTLPDAYEETRTRKKELDGDTSRLDALKDSAPDLHALVTEQGADLGEQCLVYMERLKNQKERRQAEYRLLERITHLSKYNQKNQREGFLAELVSEELENVVQLSRDDFKRQIRACASGLSKLLEEWE